MTTEEGGAKVTGFGKVITILLILGLIGVGAWVILKPKPQPVPAPAGGSLPDTGTADPGGPAGDAEIDAKAEVPQLDAPAAYVPKDSTLEIELSEYAGYAGLIAANGGLAPNENSVFFKKHGFKVKLSISEQESWSSLNSGKLAASATTVDVVAVYGKQFHVVVPVQIGFSRGADGVVVRKEIRRINDLKGKLLSTSQFTEAEFFIRYLAQEAGLQIHAIPSRTSKLDPGKLNLCFCPDAFHAGDLFLEELKTGRMRYAGTVTWAPKTTEVAAGSGGKAHLLTTNRNLLIIADILVVNKGFAQQNPKMVAGLVEGVLEGNRQVRDNAEPHLEAIAKAFKWDRAKAKSELSKVHLSNLPENVAFFSGAIDAAGSFGSIYQSAVYAYGPEFIKDPVDGDRFLDLKALKELEASGAFKDQKISISPIRSGGSGIVEGNALLSKDIRFLFEANEDKLDLKSQDNLRNLEAIKKLLQVSPGSTVLLRGHVDDAKKPDFLKQGGEALVRQMALKAMDLSKRRAAEIRKHLIEMHKVDTARIEIVGRGWEEPAGRESEANRRVEVQWFTLE
jgi:NitT/TauT family transport system substrate-binding protein